MAALRSYWRNCPPRSSSAVKILVLKNNSLAEVRFEQTELATRVCCDLSPIDFVAFARATGAPGFHCSTPAELKGALHALLGAQGPALLEAQVDPDEKPTLPDELKVSPPRWLQAAPSRRAPPAALPAAHRRARSVRGAPPDRRHRGS